MLMVLNQCFVQGCLIKFSTQTSVQSYHPRSTRTVLSRAVKHTLVGYILPAQGQPCNFMGITSVCIRTNTVL